MRASHSTAQIGIWTDYTTGETWLVATTAWGYVLLAFVGVWLSVSAKHLKQILANIALFVHNRKNQLLLRRLSAPTEETPLLDPQVLPTQSSEMDQDKQEAIVVAEIYKKGGGVRDLIQEVCFNKDFSRRYRKWLFLYVFIVSAATILYIVGSIYVFRIRSIGPAKLDSQQCGLWVYDRNRGGDEAATRAGIHDLEKEMRAGEYAQNCYGPPDMFDAIQCNFLYRSRLPFSPAKYTTDCPFENKICGQNQTVTFTTDTVDAGELGINSRSSPKFRRRTSCVPLSMESPFIQKQTHNGTTTYYYYYGEKPAHDPPVNYTYTTTGDPFDRLAPAYDVFAYTTSSTDQVESYWKPRPELTYPEFSTLSLIFVSSLRILYKKWSDDPIFPADEEVFLPGEQKPWFRNSDPRARPLACVNFIEVCLGDGKTCWPMNGHIPKDDSDNLVPTPPDFWLMYASLLKTDIYNSIEKRLGRGLIAQSMVSQYFSEALGDDHWVDEVERLVATSHARTQINAWSIASGEDSLHEGKDGYTLITTEKYGDLCGIFKYNPPGYASIHFISFILTLASFPLFRILSMKVVWFTRDFWSSKAIGVESQLEVAPDVRRGEPPQPPAVLTASGPGTGTTTGRDIVAGAGGPSSANVAQDGQDQRSQDSDSLHSVDIGSATPTPPLQGRPGSRRGIPSPRLAEATMPEETTTAATDSADTEWEPLIVTSFLLLFRG